MKYFIYKILRAHQPNHCMAQIFSEGIQIKLQFTPK
jgi:hypothetical protein